MTGFSSSFSVTILIIFSLSFTAHSFFLKLKPSPPLSPLSSPAFSRATVGDLLSLLGPKEQASHVDPFLAQELRSCFKFLVPFHPPSSNPSMDFVHRRSMASDWISDATEKENQRIWWPPAPVLELARLAVDSGGDPDAIYRTLNPTVIPVPNVEGSQESKCELTRTPYGRRFVNEELNEYIKFLFKLIVLRGPSVGLNVSLSRYDFFHGHLFIAKETERLGILFHAKEYPAYNEKTFPLNLGYCQRGSNMVYDDTMNLRNILWLAPLPSSSEDAWVAPGVLVDLDARPGGIIYRDLIPSYVRIARTLYEDDFGEPVVDVNYLNVGSRLPDYQIFIC